MERKSTKDEIHQAAQTTKGKGILLRRSVYLDKPLQEEIADMWASVLRHTHREPEVIMQLPLDTLKLDVAHYGFFLHGKSPDPVADRNTLKSILLPQDNSTISATAQGFHLRNRNRGKGSPRCPARISLEILSPDLDTNMSQLQERLTDNGFPQAAERTSAQRVILGRIREDVPARGGLAQLVTAIAIHNPEFQLGPAQIVEPLIYDRF